MWFLTMMFKCTLTMSDIHFRMQRFFLSFQSVMQQNGVI